MSLRPSTRTDVHRSRYKVGPTDGDEGSRRREDNMVKIRKNKREESLLKKRREGPQAQQFPADIVASQIGKKVTELRAAIGPISGRNLQYCIGAYLRRYLVDINRNIDKAKKMLEETQPG